MRSLALVVVVAAVVGMVVSSATARHEQHVDPASVFACTHIVWEDGSVSHVRAPGKRAPIDNMPGGCRQLILDYVNEHNLNDKPRIR